MELNKQLITDEQKELLRKAMESATQIIKEFITKVVVPLRDKIKGALSEIDLNKIKKYLKYQKRVKNRNNLYNKRKSIYGKS